VYSSAKWPSDGGVSECGETCISCVCRRVDGEWSGGEYRCGQSPDVVLVMDEIGVEVEECEEVLRYNEGSVKDVDAKP
jgi:hypothetical protein